jgi:hypothetical protein
MATKASADLQQLGQFTLNPTAQAAVLIELMGGNRLDAWRSALMTLSTSETTRSREFWLEVANSICTVPVISLPSSVANLFAELVLSKGDHVLARRIAQDPRVQMWLETVMESGN